MRFFTYLLLLSLLTACSAFQPLTRETTDRMISNYGSEVFKTGFHEGCMSGYDSAGNPYNRYTKSRDLYESNSEYKSGWDEGYDRCYKQYKSVSDTVDSFN